MANSFRNDEGYANAHKIELSISAILGVARVFAKDKLKARHTALLGMEVEGRGITLGQLAPCTNPDHCREPGSAQRTIRLRTLKACSTCGEWIKVLEKELAPGSRLNTNNLCMGKLADPAVGPWLVALAFTKDGRAEDIDHADVTCLVNIMLHYQGAFSALINDDKELLKKLRELRNDLNHREPRRLTHQEMRAGIDDCIAILTNTPWASDDYRQAAEAAVQKVKRWRDMPKEELPELSRAAIGRTAVGIAAATAVSSASATAAAVAATVPKTIVHKSTTFALKEGLNTMTRVGAVQTTKEAAKQAGKGAAKQTAKLVMGDGAKIVASGTGKLVLPEGMRVLGGKGAQFVAEGAGEIITKGAVKAGSEVSKTVVKEASKKAAIKAAAGASAAIEGGIAVAFLVKDSVEYSRGDITGKTLAKRTGRNVVKGGASVGGAVLGQIVIPVPVVGALVGGLVGSGVGWFAGWGTGLYNEDDK